MPSGTPQSEYTHILRIGAQDIQYANQSDIQSLVGGGGQKNSAPVPQFRGDAAGKYHPGFTASGAALNEAKRSTEGGHDGRLLLLGAVLTQNGGGRRGG